MPGEILSDRFEIVRRVASGGSGVVFEAVDRETGEPVAVKVLAADTAAAVKRFQREAAVLERLDHAGIAGFISSGVSPRGEYYLVEEWLPGETLRDRLDDSGLSAKQAVEMARQVAEALAAAHAAGIVHRDIKPSNIVSTGERWKLVDFGIARDLAAELQLTRTGTWLGTMGYMAPEQARAERDIDASADVFALGCVLYEVLTGRAAFRGHNALSIRAKILSLDPPDIATRRPDLPAELSELVNRMLAKSRTVRPQDGAAAKVALEALGELPDTEPVPAHDENEAATEIMPIGASQRPDPITMVLSSPLSHLAGDEIDDWIERAKDALAPFSDRPCVMADGAVMLAAQAIDDAEAAVVGARAALAVKRTFVDVEVVIVTTPPVELSHTIDCTAVSLLQDNIGALFADLSGTETATGVRIDEPTRKRLPSSFEIVGDGDDARLVGEIH